MADAASPSTTAFSPARRDLRKQLVDHVLDRVEIGLGLRLDRESVVRKRRSIGTRSDRETWVRIEVRPLAKIAAQGQAGNGMEAAEFLTGIAKPAWFGSLCWLESGEPAVWRADEVEFVTAGPVQRGPLSEDMAPSDAWWATLNDSLDALARQRTTRLATPDTEAMTEELVAREVERAFPGQVDTSLDGKWVTAHADLNWANLTGPEFWILDWEDHGLAPRGLDAANLWASSLTVPTLAERVRHERRADLETPSGKIMTLFCLAKILNDASVSEPLRDTSAREAKALITDRGH